MTWESIVLGALQGISNFAETLINLIGGALNPAAVEGIIALFAIGIAIRLIDNAPKIPGKIVERIKKRRDEDDDEWEYVRRRRRK